MSPMRVEIEGLDELLDDMRKQFPEQYHERLEVGMKVVAADVEGWAKDNSPLKTGRLRSSIGHEVRSVAGVVVGFIGSPVAYAPEVEARGRVRKGGVGRSPFLLPAVLEHTGTIYAKFKRLFDSMVDRWGD